MMWCSICLVSGVRFYKFVNSEPKRFIERIYKENGFHQVLYEHQYICYECKALLEKSYKFMKKALTAQEIIQNMCKESKITLEQLKNINRKELGLDTHLSKQENYNLSLCITHEDKFTYELNTDKSEEDIEPEVWDNECENKIDNDDTEDPLDNSHIIDGYSTFKDESSIPSGTALDLVDSKHKEEDKSADTIPVIEIADLSSDDSSCKFVPDKTSYKSDSYESYTQTISNSYRKKRKRRYKKVQDQPDIEKKVNKRIKPSEYKPSVFMLNMASYTEKKRRRNNKKYVYNDNDDSDSSIKLKNKRTSREADSEFVPEFSQDSEDSMYDRYDDLGRRIKKPDTRVYPMKCDHCEEEIPEKRRHYVHYLVNHPKIEYPYPYKRLNLLCQFCGRAFHKRQQHEAHELTHGKETPFACHKCPKKFKNKIRLLGHIRNVHLATLLECDYCGKKFKTRIDIMRHIRIHTGEKPFQCHICGYGFAHKGNIGIHIRSKHQGLSENPKKKKRQNGRESKRRCSTIDEEDEPLMSIKKRKVTKAKAKKTKRNKGES